MAGIERNPLGIRTVPEAATVVRARYWLNAVFRLIGLALIASKLVLAAGVAISQLAYTIAGVGDSPRLADLIRDIFTLGIADVFWGVIGAVLLIRPSLVTSRLLPIPLPVCPICGYKATGLRPGAPCPECGCAFPVDQASPPVPRAVPQQPRS